MFVRTLVLVKRIRSMYSAVRDEPVFRIACGALAWGILAASLWFIWKQVYSDYAELSLSNIRIDWPKLILAWLCVVAATVLGAWEWTLLVNALGGRLDYWAGMRIHLSANLSKYLPGFVWPYVGKAYLATNRGVSPGIATASIVGEFAIVYLGGFVLMLLSWPASGLVFLSTEWRLVCQFLMIFLVCLLIIFPYVSRNRLNVVLMNFVVLHGENNIDWGKITFVIIAVTCTWCLLCYGFFMLSSSLPMSSMVNPIRTTFVLPLSMLGGQLAIFVPMGIGVREAILVMSNSRESAAIITMAAMIFRIQMMLGEVFSTFLISIILTLKGQVGRHLC